MLRYRGGDKVEKGTYWDISSGGRTDIGEDGVLPGGEDVSYLKLPTAVMLLLGPVIGFIYVVFLPVIAIATVAALAVGKLFGGLVKGMSFGWRPATAHLGGKKKKKGGD